MIKCQRDPKEKLSHLRIATAAKLSRSGTADGGFLRFQVAWPRVSYVKNTTIYFHPNRLPECAQIPDHLVLTLWKEPLQAQEQGLFAELMNSGWKREDLRFVYSRTETVRFDGTMIRSMIRSLYVPKVFFRKGLPQKLVAFLECDRQALGINLVLLAISSDTP